MTGVWPDISTYTNFPPRRWCRPTPEGVGGLRGWKQLRPPWLSVSLISRAITSLLKRGMLAYRPYCSETMAITSNYGRTNGYVLTAAGLAAWGSLTSQLCLIWRFASG